MPTEPSDLWQDGRDDVEAAGGAWDEHCRTALRGYPLNLLRQIASELDVSPSGTKDELAARLVDERCFPGPAHDGTIYQDRDGEAVPIARKSGVIAARSWTADSAEE